MGWAERQREPGLPSTQALILPSGVRLSTSISENHHNGLNAVSFEARDTLAPRLECRLLCGLFFPPGQGLALPELYPVSTRLALRATEARPTDSLSWGSDTHPAAQLLSIGK